MLFRSRRAEKDSSDAFICMCGSCCLFCFCGIWDVDCCKTSSRKLYATKPVKTSSALVTRVGVPRNHDGRLRRGISVAFSMFTIPSGRRDTRLIHNRLPKSFLFVFFLSRPTYNVYMKSCQGVKIFVFLHVNDIRKRDESVRSFVQCKNTCIWNDPV